MKILEIILYGFISYTNIVAVLMFIKTPTICDVRIVSLNVLGAIIMLKMTFEKM